MGHKGAATAFDPGLIRAVAFDLDGTIYLGNTPMDGAVETVACLEGLGIRIIYFTNSSAKSRLELFEKLLRMGLTPRLEEIYSAGFAAAKFAVESGVSSVYCMGTRGLRSELEGAGLTLTDQATADAVVIGLDPDFTYKKLGEVLRFRNADVRLIACNRDRSYPVNETKWLPGCGPMVAAVEESLGRKVDAVVGEPGTYMMSLLAADFGLSSRQILVVGDSRESDIEMALRYGSPAVWIRTDGEAAPESVVAVRTISELARFFAPA